MLNMRSLFKIQKGEGSQVFLFAAIGAILVGSGIVSVSAADAALISHYGAEALGKSYIILPFLMIAVTWLFSFLSQRLGNRRCLQIMLILQAVSGALNYVLLDLSEQPEFAEWHETIYFFVKLSAEAWTIIAYTWFWNLADEYYDVQDGKRLYGIMSAGLALGTGIGGVLVGVSAGPLGIGNLLLIGPLLGLPCVMLLYRLGKVHNSVLQIEDEDEGSGFALFRILKSSPFVICVCIAVFALMMTATAAEIIYLDIFASTLDTNELAAQLGYLFGVASLANILINIFASNRIILRFGVRNVALMQPFVYLAVLSWLLIQYDYAGAIIAFMAVNVLHMSIENNNQILVLNGIPEEYRADVRNFLEGICEPFSLALAGFLVVMCSQGSEIGEAGEALLDSVSFTGISVIFCVICIIATIVLRHKYQSAYLNNLRSKWLDIGKYRMNRRRQVASVKECAVLNVQASGSNPLYGLKAIQRLYQLEPEKGCRAMVSWIQRNQPEMQQHAVPLLRKIIVADDGVWIPVLLTLVQSEMELHPQINEEFAALGVLSKSDIRRLESEEEEIAQVAGLVGRWHSYDIRQNKQVLDHIHKALDSKVDAQVALALHALGRLGDSGYAHLLATYVDHADREIRIQALEALSRIVDDEDIHVIPRLMPSLCSADAEQQSLSLDIFSRLSDTEVIDPVLNSAPYMSIPNRIRIESLIANIGFRSVPYLVSALRDSSSPFMVRSLAGRCLARVAPQQYDVVLQRLLDQVNQQAYLALDAYATIKQESGLGIVTLKHALRDQVLAASAFMLESLALAGRISDYEMLWDSLLSDNEKIRANGLEAIEQAFSPKRFKQFQFLMDAVTDRAPIEERAYYYPVIKQTVTEMLSICQQSQSLPHVARSAAAIASGLRASSNLQKVEWTDRILQEAFFTEIELTTLEILLESASEQKITLANSFDPEVEGVAYVLSGDMFATHDDAASFGKIVQQVKMASFIGMDFLWGVKTNQYSSRAGADILIFPWQNVKHAQSISAQMNRSLLKRAVGDS